MERLYASFVVVARVIEQQRRLAAILAADFAAYGSLMGADEARTLRDLKGHRAVVLPMIDQFGGHIIDTAGDGILAELGSVVNAVECAVTIQEKMGKPNANVEVDRRMQSRIGVNLGDVLYDETQFSAVAVGSRTMRLYSFINVVCGRPLPRGRVLTKQNLIRRSTPCRAIAIFPDPLSNPLRT